MIYRDLDNIVVVGGGTAGWLTALYAKKIFTEKNIILIESKDIGILGAGEGSVPGFIRFTDFLDIPISKFIKNADATIKTSVKFTNWSNDNSYFYHSFGGSGELGLSGANTVSDYSFDSNASLLLSYLKKDSVDYIDLQSATSLYNKIPFVKLHDNNYSEMSNPILDYERVGDFSLHFNAVKLAEVLRKIGEERGIIRIEGIVNTVEKNEYEEISTLNLDNNKKIKVNFLFDCTGFSRRFIGKEYNAKWISHKDKLTVNSAIPYFLPIDSKNIPPYTEARAMKYGWSWKIPTKARYGCGYVFNNNLINADEAKKEIDDYYGFEVESPRVFTFDAGYYENPWIKNCFAVGLSAGFIEPLEATSIWISIIMLHNFFSDPMNIYTREEEAIKEVNSTYVDKSNQVLDFIYYHYMSGRKDTDFWRHYTKSNAPKTLALKIDRWNYRIPKYSDEYLKMFDLNSWLLIARGKNLLNEDVVKKTLQSAKIENLIEKRYNTLREERKKFTKKCTTHSDFLDWLGK